jgi:hypothetical protein
VLLATLNVVDFPEWFEEARLIDVIGNKEVS